MSRFKIALGLFAAVAVLPAVAQAQVTVSSQDGDVGASGFSSILKNYNFDNGLTPAAFSGGSLEQGSMSNVYLAPAGDSTYYYVAGPATGGDATLSFVAQDGSGTRRSFNQLSLYWGSIDSYNSVQFNFADGSTQTFYGSNVLASPSGTSDDRTVFFNLSPSEVGNLSSVNFKSPTAAFEFDNVILGNALPEASTWAMIILGMGMVGYALRRQVRHSEDKFDAKIKAMTAGAEA